MTGALEAEAAEANAAKATFEEQLAKMRKAASYWKGEHDKLKSAGTSSAGAPSGGEIAWNERRLQPFC